MENVQVIFISTIFMLSPHERWEKQKGGRKMGKIIFLGHAAFKIETEEAKILIDPFLTGNPLAPIKASDIKDCDIVLVTHDHGDHVGDTVDICKRTGATLVAIYDLAVYLQEQGVEKVEGMNIGGTTDIKGVKITMVKAFHSATRGSPVGFVIHVPGASIYHAGDTQVFGDMKIIGELYKPDYALLPISGYYTMGPEEAALATEFLKPKIVIPMHYNTFPVIRQDPNRFAELVKQRTPEVRVVILKPGEEIEF